MTEKQTVTVEALEWHTYNGKAYAIGDTYELDAQLVESLAVQGKAIRVDRVAVAKKAAASAAKPSKTAVAPMSLKPSAVVKQAKAAKKK